MPVEVIRKIIEKQPMHVIDLIRERGYGQKLQDFVKNDNFFHWLGKWKIPLLSFVEILTHTGVVKD